MVKLLLTRHGHVEGIKPERFRGRADLSLTSLGRAQADAVAKRIASAWSAVAVYTSPMQRCISTGQAIARKCAIGATVLDDMNDIDYGRWQFKTHDEVRAESPETFQGWFKHPHLVRPPGGESLQDVGARAMNVARFALANHSEDTIVLVGHECFNRVLLTGLLDLPLSSYWRIAQAPCFLNEIDISAETIRVLRLNDSSHSEGLI